MAIELEMKIEQTDNGWILTFRGHDLLAKRIVATQWDAVLKTLDDFFGWYDDRSGKRTKEPEEG